MIYVTGDTHGTYDFRKMETFAENTPHLTKQDCVIIAGDFGGLWSPKTKENDLQAYSDLPYTVMFIDGNHENFDMLNAYPIDEWRGGKVHIIKPDIIHLMRGQVFNIEDKKIFTFGGATSVDKFIRKENESWWEEENPNYFEFEEGRKNLEANDNKVDYIITHTCDEKTLYYPALIRHYKTSIVYPENQLLTYFDQNVKYKHWYFGHYHIDSAVCRNKTALYHEFVRLS